MKGFGHIAGTIESGYTDFNGESSKLVTLTEAAHATNHNIMVTIHENQNTSASENKETDIPLRNVGNIHAAAHWVPGQKNQFRITLSAEFYGRVYWYILSRK